MAYEKRVCVLKQIKKGFSADGSGLSGAVYAERLGEELTVTPRISGIAPLKEGRYALVLRIGQEKHCFELKGNESLRLSRSPSVKNGFSVLLCYVRGEAEPVAFGRCGNEEEGYRSLLDFFSENEKSNRKKTQPVEAQHPARKAKEDAPFCEKSAVYEDEAIADADYFHAGAGNENEDADAGSGGQAQKIGQSAAQNDDSALLFPRGTLAYYESVREKLTAALRSLPKDERLRGTFPQSEWVRSEEVLLGIVYENGLPRYLCVAAEKKGEPPEEMKEHCVFVPVSPFSDEEGFYIVFQDADTGEFVRIREG